MIKYSLSGGRNHINKWLIMNSTYHNLTKRYENLWKIEQDSSKPTLTALVEELVVSGIARLPV
ncbi:hypothetical protein GF319_05055 [Candidatus Bathyarchaeota archaeon]|nr:hypothetical protein [Candidatus Bathyarchaeota archaeon]